MKKLVIEKTIAAALLLFAPMVSQGDVPLPVRRVQRVGYEVMRDVGLDEVLNDGCNRKPTEESLVIVLVLHHPSSPR